MPKRYRDIAGDGGSNIAGQVAEQVARLKARMAGVKRTLAVMSGKGGVGKSTITTNLAMFFALQGWRVGVVDADINGPSLATMFGVRGHQLRIETNGVLPAIGPLGVHLMSMDLFLADDKTPVVWNGPNAETFLWRGTMEMHTLREFLSDVQWGALDILLLDLPPGAASLSGAHVYLSSFNPQRSSFLELNEESNSTDCNSECKDWRRAASNSESPRRGNKRNFGSTAQVHKSDWWPETILHSGIPILY